MGLTRDEKLCEWRSFTSFSFFWLIFWLILSTNKNVVLSAPFYIKSILDLNVFHRKYERMQITNDSPVLPVYHTRLSPIYDISYEPAVYSLCTCIPACPGPRYDLCRWHNEHAVQNKRNRNIKPYETRKVTYIKLRQIV